VELLAGGVRGGPGDREELEEEEVSEIVCADCETAILVVDPDSVRHDLYCWCGHGPMCWDCHEAHDGAGHEGE